MISSSASLSCGACCAGALGEITAKAAAIAHNAGIVERRYRFTERVSLSVLYLYQYQALPRRAPRLQVIGHNRSNIIMRARWASVYSFHRATTPRIGGLSMPLPLPTLIRWF
jgi:hypothetical protein